MRLDEFEIQKKHIFLALALGVFFGFMQFECNQQKADKARAAEQLEAEEQAEMLGAAALEAAETSALENAEAPAELEEELAEDAEE